LRVLNCEFPDDLYFDVDNDVWFKPEGTGGRSGISTVLSFLAGKIIKAKLKTELNRVEAGKSVGTVESATYFGAVRSPVTGSISNFNSKLQEDPRSLNDLRYSDGWIVEYNDYDPDSLKRLLLGELAREKLEARILELHVNCFKLVPDDQMYSIGSECSTTLANLDDLLTKRPIGNVVHLVTDDQTADIELVRWTMRTKNELIEARKDGNLFHFILRKSKD
jgi:glycine cleavage system H lipoate-binding protein/TusA-related sulfurtransferase